MTSVDPADSLAAASVLAAFRHHVRQRPDKTAIRFLPDGEATGSKVQAASYRALDERVRALASRLRTAGASGERVLLLMPSGIDYVAAFLACLDAQALAVPGYPPEAGPQAQRLERIAADADARYAVVTAAFAARHRGTARGASPLWRTHWLAVDDDHDTDHPRDPEVDTPAPPPGQPAFLQYTSGSTSDPRGVQVTHGNLMHHARLMRDTLALGPDDVFVSWLPLFHDMGLIGAALQALAIGATLVLMPPAAFLQRPLRWLQAISHHRGSFAHAPNFAFDLCSDAAAAGGPAVAALDLAQWRIAGNAAEPVSLHTLRRFHQCLAPQGLRWEALMVGYGLAEATLSVCGTHARAEGLRVDARSLEAGQLRPALPPTPAAPAPRSLALVCCGRAAGALVVDPDRACPLADGGVGEIWLDTPTVAAGYWRRPAETALTFQARLADGRGPFLRTGDLGAMHRGELYVVGRLKDLVIVRGRNHHAADLEHSALAAHPDLARAVAWAVGHEGGEGVALAVELRRSARRGFDGDAIVAALRARLFEAHALELHTVLLLRPGALPLTSSGKVQRQLCRRQFSEGRLAALFTWQAESAPGPDQRGSTGPRTKLELDTLLRQRPEQIRAALADLLFDLLAQALKLDAGRRAALRPGFEDLRLSMLGLESLAAIELSRSIGATLDLDLPVAEVLGGQTAGEVLALLHDQLTVRQLMARATRSPTAESSDVWLL